MSDMLVNLYTLPSSINVPDSFQISNIIIKRALSADKSRIINFVKKEFALISPGWSDECEAAFYFQPVTCFFAEQNGKLLGFACYDATALGYFGPLGVIPEARKNGIGTLLLKCCLYAMKEKGYGYAIIGWVSSESFYRKAVGATTIENSSPGIYKRLIGQ